MGNSDKFILDACCGGRMFWFNKKHPNAIYIDMRTAEKGHIQNGWDPNHSVEPDEIMDFRNLRYADNSFKLVVFDPPHIIRKSVSEKSLMFKKYGTLLEDTWKDDLIKGFNECWRVLQDYGVLIFKWGESDVKKSEVLSILGRPALFGHPSRSSGTTHWICFMKIPEGGENDRH